MTDKEILEKLIIELEFVSTTHGARSNVRPRKYAAMLLDFIKTSQNRKAEGGE